MPLTPPADTQGFMTIQTFSSPNLIIQAILAFFFLFHHSIASMRDNQLRAVIAIIPEMERTKKERDEIKTLCAICYIRLFFFLPVPACICVRVYANTFATSARLVGTFTDRGIIGVCVGVY